METKESQFIQLLKSSFYIRFILSLLERTKVLDSFHSFIHLWQNCAITVECTDYNSLANSTGFW